MPSVGITLYTQATEHKAVLDTCKRLEKDGVRVTYLPVQQNGLIDLDQLRNAITDKTILITIMYANNEIGVVQPVQEIAKIAKEKGVLFHTDAVQAVGKIPVNVIADGIDVLSLTAHKLYGPKGVGALYVRRRNPRVQITAQMDGGGHERGMRSGTLKCRRYSRAWRGLRVRPQGDGGRVEAVSVPSGQAERQTDVGTG